MLKTQEHIDLMTMFEKEYKGHRLDREKNKALWLIGQIYESGETNALFLAYRKGYAYGKAIS